MLNARALELINAEIDGELQPEARAELDALLESSAEARTMKAELQRLVNVLDNAPEQVPPADLANRILERVPSRSVRPAWSIASLFSSFQPAPVGMAFAAGLLVTVGFYEMSPGHRLGGEVADMVGTMVVDPQGVFTGHDTRLTISAPGVAGAVAASNVGDVLVLSFDVSSENETEIVIGMADAGLDFGGIARGASSDPVVGEYYQISGGSLRVVNPTRSPFNVYLRRVGNANVRSQAVEIEVIQLGERVFEGSLNVQGESS
jgi:hypothetical protein